MARRSIWFLVPILAMAILAWVGLRVASIGALAEPGRTETYFATRAKRYLVGREARGVRRAERTDLGQSVMIGQMQFRAWCASCHGLDGGKPTDIGSAMYPRAPDLRSEEVQAWSDAELFWVIQNGVRLTGMPGFEKSLSNKEIWPLVDYIRSLRASHTGQPRDAELGAPSAEARGKGRLSAR